MILKRVEKDNLVKAIYKSSNILASTYDKSNNNLTITFNRGTQYTYKGVSVTDYTRFEIAESQGKILNSHIKKYEFDKGEDIDPAKIIEQIREMVNAELKAFEEGIVKKMDELISTYNKKEVMDDKLLSTIQYMISKYQKEKNEQIG